MPNVTIKNSTTNYYTVSGKTLADIHKDMLKKAPKVGGKRRGGATESKAWSKPPDVTGNITGPDAKGINTCEIRAKTVAMEYMARKCLPKLDPKSLKGLSPKAKKEWLRFAGAVEAHEDGHVSRAKSFATTVGTEIEALRFKGADADGQQACRKAMAAFEADLKANFSTDKLKARMDAIQNGYDSSTSHGGKSTQLNVGIT